MGNMYKKSFFILLLSLWCQLALSQLSGKVFAGILGDVLVNEGPVGVIFDFDSKEQKGKWRLSCYDASKVPMIWVGVCDYNIDKNGLTIDIHKGFVYQTGAYPNSGVWDWMEEHFLSNPVLMRLHLAPEQLKDNLVGQLVFLANGADLEHVNKQMVPYKLSENFALGKIDLLSETTNLFSSFKFVVLEEMAGLPKDQMPF